MSLFIQNKFHKNSFGEMFPELTSFHGLEINIFHNIVEHAGLLDQQVAFLTELT